MEKFIVYLDDAEFAQQQLRPMLVAGESADWILVACVPKLPHGVGKWISPSACESWRQEWAQTLFDAVTPLLKIRGDSVQTEVAHHDLREMSATLQRLHGAAHVMDARRPKFGQALLPVTEGQMPQDDSQWQLPAAVTALGALLILAAE